MYGFYTYGSNDKRALVIYEFDSGDVERVREEDYYSYNVRTKKVFYDHNTRMRFKNMPRTLNMTSRQLERWTSPDLNEVVKIALQEIFVKNTIGTL